jgi:hypothetical protein
VNGLSETDMLGPEREPRAHDLAVGFQIQFQTRRIVQPADKTGFGVRQL